MTVHRETRIVRNAKDYELESVKEAVSATEEKLGSVAVSIDTYAKPLVKELKKRGWKHHGA